MMKPIKVNHVLSQDIYSKIFEAIFGYFDEFTDNKKIQHSYTVKPQHNVDIYHYHRPHLEEEVLTKSIATVHHDLHDNDPWLALDKFISIYRRFDHIACLNSIQQNILSSYKINNSSVIPWGYNSKIFTDVAPHRQKEKLCLGVVSKRYGRKVKGEALLYELLKRLPTDKFKFIFVGEGRSEEVHYASTLGFECKGYEYLPYNVFNGLYNELDVLLVLSCFEGGPASIPEAFAKGVPIVSTRVGFAADFLEDGKNGLILVGDPNIDSITISRLLDEEFYSNLKKNAIKTRARIPTWEDAVNKYNNIYISLA